ncbi:MAG: RNA polymerase sigma factor [Clostridia bacterium]|nr:RNA polymerase sigma factor [Clostridia bacterium]
MEDKQIIELYFARNESAIAETDKKYGAYCRTVAYRILEDRLDSEEIANDTYLRLWNSIPPQRPDPLKPYIGRISRNLALDVYDAKHAKKRGGVTLALEELAECLPFEDGREIGESAALSDLLSRFISSLRERERTIFVRRYFHLSHQTLQALPSSQDG